METKNIHIHTPWMLSYMNDSELQVKTLIECQKKKIEQLNETIKNIKLETQYLENSEDIMDYVAAINKIEKIIEDISEVKVQNGIFEWVG